MQLKWKSKQDVVSRDRAFLFAVVMYFVGVIVGYLIGVK